MAGAVSAAVVWTAEDDVLLKTAVEAGASLESLAKGAVCFSQKFTLPELHDRWHSLLYDSEISAQASARMANYEMELSASHTAKATKVFNSKAKFFSLYKRKIDSVKNQYYAMRKRVWHEPYAPCSCNPADDGGCACGGNHLLHNVDPSGGVVCGNGFAGGCCAERKHTHSNGNGQYSFHTEHADSDGSISMVIDGNTDYESPHGYSDVDQLYGYGSMQKDSQSSGSNKISTDLSDQFDNGAKGSNAQPHQKDLGPHTPHTTNCAKPIDPIQRKQNVADISGVDTLPASSVVLYPEHNVKCMLNTEDSEIPFSDHIDIPDHPFLESTSTFDQDSEHDACLVAKLIKMENGQPSSPLPTVNLESSILEQNANMVSRNEGCIVWNELPPGLNSGFDVNVTNTCISVMHSVDGGEETACDFVQHESCANLLNLTLDKSIQVSDQMNCKLLAHKPKIGCETAIRSCDLSNALPDTEFHNPVVAISTSGQAEGSDSENSVPNYFDIEALILDQDLIPWDQESTFIQPEVSRFQYPENRKDLIRLEKGASSYMNRSIMSGGAFAILYGRHLKYYIRDPEVTLGRETGEVHVDIDLGKEGNANKISRRQAVIKMDDDGSFYMTNIGKCSVFVNGKEVPCGKRMKLISDSVLEIRNMKLIFHVSHDAVRQYIVRSKRGSSQGAITAFDWDQSP